MTFEFDYYVYMLLAFTCFILSLFYTNKKRRYVSIYFASVILVDGYMGLWYDDFLINIHPYAVIFFMLFFIYYYRKELGSKAAVLIGLLVLFISLYLNYITDNEYDIRFFAVMIICYIFLPLIYFYRQIVKVDEVSLIQKQKFWFSASLLLWIVFFTFRMIPFYFLVENDYAFIDTLNFIFGIANVVSYILFLIGILAKYE